MFQSAHPGDEAFHTHAETTMWNATVFSQVDIPIERFARQFMFIQTLQQEIQIVNTLATTDDLAVAFRGNEIDPQSEGVVL